MLHPSYTDLMKVVNSEVGEGDTPVVNSRYSIVMATAKRARQIIAGQADVTEEEALKPLSTAVKELNEGKIKIIHDEAAEEEDDEALKALLRMKPPCWQRWNPARSGPPVWTCGQKSPPRMWPCTAIPGFPARPTSALPPRRPRPASALKLSASSRASSPDFPL